LLTSASSDTLRLGARLSFPLAIPASSFARDTHFSSNSSCAVNVSR
jgi:hypothetical protein